MATAVAEVQPNDTVTCFTAPAKSPIPPVSPLRAGVYGVMTNSRTVEVVDTWTTTVSDDQLDLDCRSTIAPTKSASTAIEDFSITAVPVDNLNAINDLIGTPG